MLSTPKLKELRCHKTRLKQPLLRAMTTPNFSSQNFQILIRRIPIRALHDHATLFSAHLQQRLLADGVLDVLALHVLADYEFLALVPAKHTHRESH